MSNFVENTSSQNQEDGNNFVPYYMRKDLKHNRGKKQGNNTNQRRRRKSVTEVIIDFHKNQAQTQGENLSETQILSKVTHTKVLLSQQVQDQDTKEVKTPILPSLKDFEKFSLRNEGFLRESLSVDCSPRGNWSPVPQSPGAYSPLNHSNTNSPRTTTNSPTYTKDPYLVNFKKDLMTKLPLKLQKDTVKDSLPKIFPLNSPRGSKLNSPRLQEIYSSPRTSTPKAPQSPRSFQEVKGLHKIPNFESLQTPKTNHDISSNDSSSSRDSSPRVRLSSPVRQRVEPYFSPRFVKENDTPGSLENSPRRRGYSLSWKPRFGNKIEDLINHEEDEEVKNLLQSPSLTLTVGMAGEIASINDQFSSILGYKREELMKKNIRMIVDENHPFKEQLFRQLSETNQPTDMKMKFIHKSGEIMDVLLRLKLIHEEVFNKDFFLCIIYDVMRDLKNIPNILGKLSIQ